MDPPLLLHRGTGAIQQQEVGVGDGDFSPTRRDVSPELVVREKRVEGLLPGEGCVYILRELENTERFAVRLAS